MSARPKLFRWLPLLGLGVVLAVALWVGTSSSSGHRSIDDRVQNVTSGLRCPVCTGETVADSAAPISQDIRGEVRQLLLEGYSDSQAKAFILSKYPGTSLSTPTSGLALLVWALPVVAIASAVIGLALMFSRWRACGGVTVSDEDRRLVDEARRGPD